MDSRETERTDERIHHNESLELHASSVAVHEEKHGTAATLMISTKESTFNRNRVTSRVSGKLPVCACCDGSYWTDECRMYKTIEDRKQRIKGKCFICLKPGHRSKKCRVVKSCYHCNLTCDHHRTVCP